MVFPIPEQDLLIHHPKHPPKKFAFECVDIRNNVLLVCVSEQAGFFNWVYMRRGLNEYDPQQTQPLSKSKDRFFIMCLLRPFLAAVGTDNGHPQYTFNVGMGDGDVNGFSGSMAAQFNITFYPYDQTSTIRPFKGKSVPLPGSILTAGAEQPWTLDTSNISIFGTDGIDNRSCRIKAMPDKNVVDWLKIEKQVVIYVYDETGRLLGMIDIIENKDVIIQYGLGSGLRFLFMVRGKKDKDYPDFELFEVGDPRTNAIVTITEEDV